MKLRMIKALLLPGVAGMRLSMSSISFFDLLFVFNNNADGLHIEFQNFDQIQPSTCNAFLKIILPHAVCPQHPQHIFPQHFKTNFNRIQSKLMGNILKQKNLFPIYLLQCSKYF